jgi:hypothetical protein
VCSRCSPICEVGGEDGAVRWGPRHVDAHVPRTREVTSVIVMALALLIGASTYTAAWIAFAIVGRDPTGAAWMPLNLLVVGGSIGIAAGLPSLHALQDRQAGALGTAATAMLVVGFLLAGVARQSVEAFTLPVMPRVPAGADGLVAVAGPLLFVGMVTLGIVTMRAGVFPPWTGAALVVAALAGAFAAYVPIPTALHFTISALAALILAYLGLLVVLATLR